MPSRPTPFVSLTELLPQLLGPDLIKIEGSCQNPVLFVYTASIARTVTILRDHPQCDFRQLIDITVIDYPKASQRFELIYNLLSHKHNRRLCVKIHTGLETSVSSITSVFSCANWYEREVWDLFGIPIQSLDRR